MEIRTTEAYQKWFDKLADDRAKARIRVRIRRLEKGNPGDVKPVGDGISEMRIDYGQGYRLYYKAATSCQDTGEIVILLCGGDTPSKQILPRLRLWPPNGYHRSQEDRDNA
jgi:putative addiction module killer protein